MIEVLADLAPRGGGSVYQIKPSDTVDLDPTLGPTMVGDGTVDPLDAPSFTVDADLGRLAKAVKLSDNAELRVGWLWRVFGSGDERRTYPVLSAPVDVSGRLLGRPRVTIVSDWEAYLLEGPAARIEAEHALSAVSDYTAWTVTYLNGSRLVESVPPGERGVERRLAIFLSDDSSSATTIGATLRQWNGAALERTAFAATYGIDEPGGDRADTDRVESSIVLNPAQRAAVADSRHRTVSVVSGPPGTGKTQTICAIALDAVERGESVLVGAPSAAAVEALVDLFNDIPGPDPVVFGATARRADLVARLGQGGGADIARSELEQRREALERATRARDDIAELVAERLSAERFANATSDTEMLLAQRVAPAWFAHNAPLDESRHVAATIASQPRGGLLGWFDRWRAERHLGRLNELAGANGETAVELERVLDIALARRAASGLRAEGGLDLEGVWPDLVDAEERRRAAHARWLHAFTHTTDRVGRAERAAMSSVAAAIRSGRRSRRSQLARLDGRELSRALPLWVGTIRDIDDLLPQSPGMFDLVIIDEASKLDQIATATATLRARRAVVVGDPKQLRHVSFLADDHIEAALNSSGLDRSTRSRLDVRRLSAFDLAASAAPVRFLDEHFRSIPHLIDFSARRYYDGDLDIATRHPRVDDVRAIDVRRGDGTRGKGGLNPGEADEVLAVVGELATLDDPPTVGVVTPYRAQADHIAERVIAELSADTIDLLQLRTGTVHDFQGCEREVMVISPTIDARTSANSARFLNDDHVFNVMVTRARSRVVVTSSLRDVEHASGAYGDYLRHARDWSPRARDGSVDDLPSALARALSDEFTARGVAHRTGYPAGTHRIDLVLGSGERALALHVGVHPDGPDAHIERRLELARLGWAQRDLFTTRWSDRLAELVVELALDADSRTG